ncbi:MAG: 30S ribosomal protein S12 methylthiotransferase RimO [Gammaproteobacteria bacterium]|nr:30S ribosomal protein S12 methylthiotransferase RimO [Gammaproteobacteria bacterium]MBT4607183.1 30S ribosomal protein S12 methylthiotransferase RimO [Thiotrichales bacterium]MBT3472519.1 30S ribosomal protein S12 methylthiotransferase RimO [Gammaproteobacteria bacterium]MBT3966753.1 30S ribosomal protein S12 methylthiotransferase RimO [Gammaproteobacteria bacterium]MBT4081954.1 30S ribosomal protein S12 methylthiotransferase RimO [Gammaproteobacteria bacterium]
MSSSPKIGFVSLGCPKATVDSERILSQLRAEGYLLVNSYEAADLVIINTCGFIDAAVEESLDTIGEAMEQNGRVIVSGCLGGDKEKILSDHPDVLAITGPNETAAVMDAVHAAAPPPQDPLIELLPDRAVRLTPNHYAYLKIAEGCNQQCSFCIIPNLRGKLVSRPIGELLGEAERLAESGVKELLVVSQDTAAYGADLRYRSEIINGGILSTRITTLAEELSKLGIWIRLHYLYPYPVIDQLIPMMAEGKILPYLDVPLQHASPTILKAMKRPADQENALRRIEQWRSICPDLTIRSTFIVGFPSETDADFGQLLDFLDAAQLDRAGAFAYSPVEGAAANELPNPLDHDIKQDRLEQFMALQSSISASKLQQKVGTTETILIDTITDEGAIGRSRGDAPEIDGEVHLPEVTHLNEGDFVEVKLIAADEHDMEGALL